MFSRYKPLRTLDRTQKPFGFVCVNGVLNVLLVRYKFQVFKPVVSAVKVFVVDLQTAFNWPIKRFPHCPMNANTPVNTIFAKANLKIPLKQKTFAQSVRRLTSPSFALLDGMRCGYASTQKNSNLFKSSAVFEHLFSFGNFGGVKRFSPSNPARIAKVANFVQAFKAKNWFPCFHSLSPFNMNRSIA
jgi:hypothetical protein